MKQKRNIGSAAGPAARKRTIGTEQEKDRRYVLRLVGPGKFSDGASFDKYPRQEDKEKQIEEQNIWKRLQ